MGISMEIAIPTAALQRPTRPLAGIGRNDKNAGESSGYRVGKTGKERKGKRCGKGGHPPLFENKFTPMV